ncbi:MAG: cytochrome [Acidobacteria bacterium]|nr:cytochrome [Acidobacteriota bacterium]
MTRRRIVAVIGAGERCRAEDRELARELGERIAREGWILLSGGRDTGVMAAANEGAKRVEGSITVGILPSDDRRDLSQYVDIPVVTGLGGGRNNVIALSSEVVIACGAAGTGTSSEIALALKSGKRVLLLRAEESAREFFATLGGSRVMNVDTAEDAVALARDLLSESERA